MFSEPTAFIIGAGASAEYNIAVGDKLKLKIAELLNFYFDGGALSRGDGRIAEHLKQHSQQVTGQYVLSQEHFKAARLISQAMPHALSIDNFIDAHRGNEAVALCAKLAIAKAILTEERRSRISGLERPFEHFDFASVGDTWITRLFQMMSESVTRDELPTVFRNLSLIIFNYDRCIEAYIPRALSEYYDITPSEAATLMAGLKIIHPYGVAGGLSADGTLSVPYGSADVDLTATADGIRTFSEGVADESTSDEIQFVMSSVHTLVFIGFSFHPLNMKLLESTTQSLRRIFATTFGLSKSAVASVEQILLQIFDKISPRSSLLEWNRKQLDELEMVDLKAYDFCTQYFRSLSTTAVE